MGGPKRICAGHYNGGMNAIKLNLAPIERPHANDNTMTAGGPTVILALETSTEYCSVALLIVPAELAQLPSFGANAVQEGGALSAELPAGLRAFYRHELTGAVSSTLLLPAVQALFARAGLPLSACTAIAFGAGPGSFTGLRTATGVAQGLAFALQVPVIPVGTLMACAEAARAADPELGCVLAALDARMDEAYWALFAVDADAAMGWRVLQSESLDAPQALAVLIEPLLPPGQAFTLAGNAAAAFGERLSAAAQARALAALALPHALPVAVLGWRAWRAGLALPADQAAPLYVRDKVAQTTEERAAAKALRPEPLPAGAPQVKSAR